MQLYLIFGYPSIPEYLLLVTPGCKKVNIKQKSQNDFKINPLSIGADLFPFQSMWLGQMQADLPAP